MELLIDDNGRTVDNVAEQWKTPASASNEHDHLGQIWEGNRNPVQIRGDFPDRIRAIPFPSKEAGNFDLLTRTPSAPLILDNTSALGHALLARSVGTGVYASGGIEDPLEFIPDVVLGGRDGIISATEENSSRLAVISNRNILLWLDRDGNDDASFQVLSGEGPAPKTLLTLDEDGQLFVGGDLIHSKALTPTDFSSKSASERLSNAKDTCDGVVTLDSGGEALVELPPLFGSIHSIFR